MALWKIVALPLVVILAVNLTFSKAENPGLAVRVSQSFLDFALKNLVEVEIKRRLGNAKIPPSITHSGISLGGLSIDNSRTTFQPTSFLKPNEKLSSLEANICLTIYATSGWVKRVGPYKLSGTMDITLPVCVDVAVSMSPSPANLWLFRQTYLNVESHVNIHIKGFIGKFAAGPFRVFLNGLANKAIKSYMEDQAHKLVDRITPLMKEYLPYLKFDQCRKWGLPDGCQDFGLNLSLTSPGVWKDNCYTEIQLNGNFVYRSKSYLPGPALAFPPVAAPCGDRDVSLFISHATLSSAANALLRSNLFRFRVPTSTYTDDLFIIHYIPGLSKKFGHLPLHVTAEVSQSEMKIAPDGITVIWQMSVQVFVDTDFKGTLAEAFTVQVEVAFLWNVYLKSISTPAGLLPVVCMNMTDTQIEIDQILKSEIGEIDTNLLGELFQKQLIKTANNFNYIGNKGIFTVPSKVAGAATANPLIQLGKWHLRLGINLKPAEESDHVAQFFGLDEDQSSTVDSRATPLFDMVLDDLPNVIEGAKQSVFEAILEFKTKFLNLIQQSL